MIQCSQCDKDILPDFEDAVRRSGLDICPDCRVCDICIKSVSDAELAFNLKYDRPMRHARCHKAQQAGKNLFQDAGKIEIDAQELLLLNLCRLICIPDSSLSTETNVYKARLAQNQLWAELSIEGKYQHTQMMETVYGEAYIALKKDPSDVKAKLLERDKQRMTEAHESARKDRQRQLPSERRKLNNQEKFMEGMLKSGLTKENAIMIWKSQGRIWVE